VIKLPFIGVAYAWGHLCRLRFLDGCINQQQKRIRVRVRVRD
jgi:hypothetical protein